VAPGGPAARAGLQAKDVLTQANGRTLRNYLDWEAVKLDLHVGDGVKVTYRQGGKTTTATITTGDLPTVAAEKVTVLKDLQLVTVTPAIQAEQGVQSGRGALIFRIADALAQSTGLRRGDVIVAMNRRYIRSADDVNDVIENLRSRQPVRLYFERDQQILYTDLVFQ
jgi:Trypsin-like serine proteases, typically periplasmic, contain C-terminal PDZ domain